MSGRQGAGNEWRRYHDATRYASLPERLAPDLWPANWVDVEYKRYPDAPAIVLPDPRDRPQSSLWDVLARRHTTRNFKRAAIDSTQLSVLLARSSGLRLAAEPDIGNRSYPSAGARYPLEVYAAVRSAEDVPAGVYHYRPQDNALERIGHEEVDLVYGSLADDWMRDASVVLILTALFERNFRKYGQRGYRDVLIETGHLGQNIALVSTALGLGWCGVGAYLDDVVNSSLGIDGISETVVAMHLIGEPGE